MSSVEASSTKLQSVLQLSKWTIKEANEDIEFLLVVQSNILALESSRRVRITFDISTADRKMGGELTDEPSRRLIRSRGSADAHLLEQCHTCSSREYPTYSYRDNDRLP